MPHTIAVTGHRPDKLGGYDDPLIFDSLVTLAKAQLKQLNPQEVITGMALGWDQAVAQACAELGIPFVAAVPFRGQESAWPESSQRTYHRLLGLAKKIVICCDGAYHPNKMQQRNAWMVKHADFILALWDGSDGGTSNCLAYARRKGIFTRNVYNQWLLSL